MPWLYYECLLTIAAAYNAYYALGPPGWLQELRYYWAICQEEIET